MRIREQFGIEAAEVVLGHRMGSKITENYAKQNKGAARKVMAEVG
jgi:hypothetical protein